MTVLIEFNDLAKFREHWTGTRILDLLTDSGGKLLINWPIGVGKSHNIDDLIEAAVRSGQYDLVVVLLPTRDVLKERRWIKAHPLNINIVNLRPRPKASCGNEADRQWNLFEKQGLGLYGRHLLCRPCPNYQNCFWPGQYGRTLNKAQVIFGTQTHLGRDPTFITQLQLWTRARRVLVILDEANFILKSQGKKIRRQHLTQFISVLERILNERRG